MAGITLLFAQALWPAPNKGNNYYPVIWYFSKNDYPVIWYYSKNVYLACFCACKQNIFGKAPLELSNLSNFASDEQPNKKQTSILKTCGTILKTCGTTGAAWHGTAIFPTYPTQPDFFAHDILIKSWKVIRHRGIHQPFGHQIHPCWRNCHMLSRDSTHVVTGTFVIKTT